MSSLGTAIPALLQNEVAWFDRDDNSSAMVTSRLSTDTSVLRIALSERLVLLIQYLTSVVVAVALAFTFSWRMALVSLTLIPFAMFSGAMRVSKSCLAASGLLLHCTHTHGGFRPWSTNCIS